MAYNWVQNFQNFQNFLNIAMTIQCQSKRFQSLQHMCTENRFNAVYHFNLLLLVREINFNIIKVNY